MLGEWDPRLSLGVFLFISRQVGAPGRRKLKNYAFPEDAFAVALQSETGSLDGRHRIALQPLDAAFK